jgi:hypothetical protein
MTLFDVMLWCGIAIFLAALAPFAFSRRKSDTIDPYADYFENHVPATNPPALDRMRDRMTVGFKEPDMEKRHEARRFPRARRDFGSRPPVRKPAIFLTPRQLTYINEHRRVQGLRPLNREGFKAATARASMYERQPDTSTEWITYFILYEVLSGLLTQTSAHCNVGLTIQPDAPFNGHDGEFGGAGASGNWQDAPAAVTMTASDIADTHSVATTDPYIALAAGVGAGMLDDSGGPARAPSDTSSYTPPQAPEPAYSAPDPTPSYSAPDPSPSYTPSSDSGSSYSGSSDSGSSGGGDSGGGGGGGGD